MMPDLLQTGESDCCVLMIKHRDLEAVLGWLACAQVDRSELLALLLSLQLEARGGGEGQVLDTVHLGHVTRPPHPSQDLLG